jgi:hypothetical protein
MKFPRTSVVTIVVAMATALSLQANTIFVDFGETAQQTSGNYNNIFVGSGTSSLSILNAIDSIGAPTGIGMLASGFQPGSNQNGTTSPGAPANMFAPQATRDNMFGNSVLFNGYICPLGTVALTGLDGSGNTAYSFTFFGSRIGASDNRETEYEVVGANTGFGLLNTANNSANVASVANIIPDALGDLTINVSKGPNNNNGSGFFYLGAMSIEYTVVPEPSTIGLGILGLGWMLISRRLRATRN